MPGHRFTSEEARAARERWEEIYGQSTSAYEWRRKGGRTTARKYSLTWYGGDSDNLCRYIGCFNPINGRGLFCDHHRAYTVRSAI